MDYSVLEKSVLFHGIPASDIRTLLESVPHHMQCYDKGETIFHLMEQADHVGIVLEGRVEAQKSFPNGSQINVSVRCPGEMIGPAAVFSVSHTYPCDVVATEPVTVIMYRREDLLLLMQKDIRILENFTTEVSSAAYMLQQRLELLSYNGIAQKAACYLLIQQRKTGTEMIPVPGSMSKWAMIMNVSRTSLHRELKKLESQGIINIMQHKIQIIDPAALQEVLSD